MKVITNNHEANWTMSKIKELQREVKKVKDYAEEERALINAWEVKEVKPHQEAIEHFTTLVMAYYAEETAKDSKFKLSVPHGKINKRKSKKWVYEDEEQLINWLNVYHPNLVRIKQEVIKTDLKKQFKSGVIEDTGEVIPYINIIEDETINLTFNEVTDNE